MAEIVVTPRTFDVAPANQQGRRVGRTHKRKTAVVGRDEGLFRGRKERVVAVDRCRIPKEEAARRDLRVGLVVMETQLGIRAHLRMEIQVRERVEADLLRGPAVIVIRSEIEPVGSTPGRSASPCPRAASSVRYRELRPVARVGNEAAGETGRRSLASEGFAVAQRARAEVAVPLQDRLFLLVGEEHRRVALVVREVAAHQEAHAIDCAVRPDITGNVVSRYAARVGNTARPDNVGGPLRVVLLVVIEAVVQVDLQAFEPVVHDEVNDAGDCIGAIHSRCTARKQLDALDERCRDLVQVGRGAGRTRARAARGQPAAVQEHEVARRTQVAQVDVRRAVGAVRLRAGLRCVDLRHVEEQVLGLRQAVHADFLRVQHRDGACALDAERRQARAGDFHPLDALSDLLLRIGELRHDRECNLGSYDCGLLGENDGRLLVLSHFLSHAVSGVRKDPSVDRR